MEAPICDFVRRYTESDALRLHMPGHKGVAILGMEQLDITEIDGADSLYEADGIIRRSEENASSLFGCPTYYSTEGSSQCIRAMLYLALLHAKQHGKKPVIAAGRNAHKTFLSAAALLDLEIAWLYPEKNAGYLSCDISPEALERFLTNTSAMPVAVYLTSPDYLGMLADVRGISQVCRKYDILLLVDNAHGAYLRFLPQSLFPVDQGADLCCSSAHKTLPVLTGGAYLHLSEDMEAQFSEQVKMALALFGSTSPSYLILQSLDAANSYLSEYPQRFRHFVQLLEELKARLNEHGFCLCSQEPMKITISAKPWGYTGTELAQLLLQRNIVCEFADKDYLVLMPTPAIGETGLRKLEAALTGIIRKPAIQEPSPNLPRPERILSVREAAFSPVQILPADECEGRILAAATVACPPAVPILVCGERIDRQAITCFQYYGVECCTVVAERKAYE